MLVDYRKRCVIEADGYDIIRYGVCAAEANESEGGHWRRDLPAPYAKLSRGGRRPGDDKKRVEINGTQKFFFTKHLGREDVQGDSDVDRIRARYGIGGPIRTQETAPKEGGVGGSGENSKEGEVT